MRRLPHRTTFNRNRRRASGAPTNRRMELRGVRKALTMTTFTRGNRGQTTFLCLPTATPTIYSLTISMPRRARIAAGFPMHVILGGIDRAAGDTASRTETGSRSGVSPCNPARYQVGSCRLPSSLHTSQVRAVVMARLGLQVECLTPTLA